MIRVRLDPIKRLTAEQRLKREENRERWAAVNDKGKAQAPRAERELAGWRAKRDERERAQPERRVEVRDNKIIINEYIQFEYGSAKTRKVSHQSLDEIARVLQDNPQILEMEIQGHVNSQTPERERFRLSQERAIAVRQSLIVRGIEASRLTSKGCGSTRPITDVSRDSYQEANRRIEFNITKQLVTKTKVEVDEWGNETVIERRTRLE